MAGKLERDFQSTLIKELKDRFPGCMVTKLDSSHIQGIPDLLVLYKDRWAALECKKDAKAAREAEQRPNQGLRVRQMNDMSYASFIFPENKESVINDLERLFSA